MSADSRRVEKVFSVMQDLASAGDGLVRVGEIADITCTCVADINALECRVVTNSIWRLAIRNAERNLTRVHIFIPRKFDDI